MQLVLLLDFVTETIGRILDNFPRFESSMHNAAVVELTFMVFRGSRHEVRMTDLQTARLSGMSLQSTVIVRLWQSLVPECLLLRDFDCVNQLSCRKFLPSLEHCQIFLACLTNVVVQWFVLKHLLKNSWQGQQLLAGGSEVWVWLKHHVDYLLELMRVAT